MNDAKLKEIYLKVKIIHAVIVNIKARSKIGLKASMNSNF